MQLIQPWTTDPYLNLAFEEVLLKYTSENYFLVWQNSPAVIIGRHQNAASEVNLPLARSLNIPVIRRITGGGAVYHDNGTVNFSFITNQDCSTGVYWQRILSIFPHNFVTTQRNDVLINGKKVMGTAQNHTGKRHLFHASILFNTDLKLLDKILTPCEEKMRRHGISSAIQRVTNLEDCLYPKQTIEQFCMNLRSILHSNCTIMPSSLGQDLITLTRHFAKQKYRSENWNKIEIPEVACDI